jgi:hypothetical protein
MICKHVLTLVGLSLAVCLQPTAVMAADADLADLNLPEAPRFDKSDTAETRFQTLRSLRTEIILKTPQLKSELDRASAQLNVLKGEQTGLQQRLISSPVDNTDKIEQVSRNISLGEEELKLINSQIDAIKGTTIPAASPNRKPSNVKSTTPGSKTSISANDENADLMAPLIKRQKLAEDNLAFLRSVLATQKREAERDAQNRKVIQDRLASIPNEIKAAEDKVAKYQKAILYMGDLEGKVNDLINALLIPESAKNEFKTTISQYFAYMVGAVIALFFGISFWDENVRRTIFRNQAGIQFITLFSLVIAIILFGITGILEAKELSALLGGISGYILGRVTDRQEATQENGPAPASA